MSHARWNHSLPTCELVLRAEYETLSPNPAARVDGDLRVSLQRLAVPQPGFAQEDISTTRNKILRYFQRPSGARLAVQDMIEYKLDLHPMDLAAAARACGLLGITVRTPEELEKALAAAMTADRTTLIDAQVDPRPYQDSFGPTIGVLN